MTMTKKNAVLAFGLIAAIGAILVPVVSSLRRRTSTDEFYDTLEHEDVPDGHEEVKADRQEESEAAVAGNLVPTESEETVKVPCPVRTQPTPAPEVLLDKTNTTPPSPPQITKKRYDPSRAAVSSTRETIHFAAGCFWSVELAFQRSVGVYSTRVGYTQGNVENPTYDDVKTGKSGHVEAVEVVYDTSLVSLNDLMEVFWGKHDPTKKNRAGNDKGTQYRSGVYYSTEEQKEIVMASVKNRRAQLKKPWLKVHTEVKPMGVFYEAEEYHQKYLSEKGGRHGKAQSAMKGCTDRIRCYG